MDCRNIHGQCDNADKQDNCLVQAAAVEMHSVSPKNCTSAVRNSGAATDRCRARTPCGAGRCVEKVLPPGFVTAENLSTYTQANHSRPSGQENTDNRWIRLGRQFLDAVRRHGSNDRVAASRGHASGTGQTLSQPPLVRFEVALSGPIVTRSVSEGGACAGSTVGRFFPRLRFGLR